jgi:hypothetical protein
VAEDKISSNRNPSLEARRIRRLAYSRLRYFEMTKRNFMREVAWLLISDPNAESAGRWGFQGDFGHNDPGNAHHSRVRSFSNYLRDVNIFIGEGKSMGSETWKVRG